MISKPQNKTNIQQTYSKLWATDPSLAYFIEVELAPSTNVDGYKPGCILAQYTAGQYIGQCVNYDPSGTNGQNVALAVLTDQYLIPDVQKLGTQGEFLVQGVLAGATFYQDKVYFNKQDSSDDIAPAIAQIGGKIAFGRIGLYAIGR